jgi:putative DNA primase/helicase
MRQDFFEYVPQFKLVIAGNHKPALRSVDEAIRRRFNLIPFTFTIPPDQRDKDFGKKLKAEWPGILAWMIRGCLDWQQRGLDPPRVVTMATEEYMQAQDAIQAWIDDQCQCDPNYWERSQTLFTNWKLWAERSGVFIGNTTTFRDRLEAKGINYKREAGTGQRGYQGIRITPSAEQNEPYWNR